MSSPPPKPLARRPLSLPDPYFLTGMVSVLLLAALYLFQTQRQGTSRPTALPASLFASFGRGGPLPQMGRDGAPVRVVEIMEYQCPACAEAHTRNWPILRRLASEGRIAFRVENVPLPGHPNAIPAGVFATCVAAVSPGHFWDYHATLLEHQREWAEKYDVDPVFAGLAQRVGGDTTAVRRCLKERGEQIATALRSRYPKYAQAGFSSVPVWSVNGRIVPWARVESEIAAAERASRGGG